VSAVVDGKRVRRAARLLFFALLGWPVAYFAALAAVAALGVVAGADGARVEARMHDFGEAVSALFAVAVAQAVWLLAAPPSPAAAENRRERARAWVVRGVALAWAVLTTFFAVRGIATGATGERTTILPAIELAMAFAAPLTVGHRLRAGGRKRSARACAAVAVALTAVAALHFATSLDDSPAGSIALFAVAAAAWIALTAAVGMLSFAREAAA